ncbi:unnamed protein product, partial [Symbiodinium necroappetens]
MLSGRSCSRDLHRWNPNPVRSSVPELEQEEVLVDEEEAEEAEQDDRPDTWPDYYNDEEGEEGHQEVIENDAVLEIMKDYEIPEDVQQSFFQLRNDALADAPWSHNAKYGLAETKCG